MAGSNRWAGWIGFAGWLMIIIGVLDFFEGLIAVIRGQYYVLTANQILVFNLRTWGWVTLIWGIVILMAGLGLLSGSGWARWFAIVVGSLNFIGQLGFVGSAAVPAVGAHRARPHRGRALRADRPLGRRHGNLTERGRALGLPSPNRCSGGLPRLTR